MRVECRRPQQLKAGLFGWTEMGERVFLRQQLFFFNTLWKRTLRQVSGWPHPLRSVFSLIFGAPSRQWCPSLVLEASIHYRIDHRSLTPKEDRKKSVGRVEGVLVLSHRPAHTCISYSKIDYFADRGTRKSYCRTKRDGHLVGFPHQHKGISPFCI